MEVTASGVIVWCATAHSLSLLLLTTCALSPLVVRDRYAPVILQAPALQPWDAPSSCAASAAYRNHRSRYGTASSPQLAISGQCTAIGQVVSPLEAS